MIYFYQNKFLHMYFSKIMQTFYDLLFLIIININCEAVLLDHNRPHREIE